MKALRWHGRGDVRLDDVESPTAPGPHELQIDVLACGICGTDVEEYRNGPLFVATDPHPLTGHRAPVILGHEFAGRVSAVGAAVADRAVGDLVAVAPDVACGTCQSCRSGRPNLCPLLGSLGLSADGGLAERCNVASSSTVVLPDTVAPEAGALIETVAVALRAVRQGRLRAEDRVAIFGGGAVGLLTVQVVVALGVRDIVLVDPLDSRRAAAAALGATVAGPADASELEVDLAIECSGSAPAIETAVAACARAARLVVVGLHAKPTKLDALRVTARELEIRGSMSYVFGEDYVDAARLVVIGVVDAGAVISDRVPLSRSIDRGLDALAERPQDHVKIIVQPASAPNGG